MVMFYLCFLLYGLRAHAATLPYLYDDPGNQGNQPLTQAENGQGSSTQGLPNYDDRNNDPNRGYYPQQVNPEVPPTNRLPYYNNQGNAVYDPRSVWYGGPNVQNPNFQSGYPPYRYDPRYGYSPQYPYGVPYGPQNYYPQYYPYSYYPYNYGPQPYLPAYGNYVNRPGYNDQVYFNGYPSQPYTNSGQGYQQPYGNPGQQGPGNIDRQPNYIPTGSGGNGQWNQGTWQSGENTPNNQSPFQTNVPYNPVAYMNSGQQTLPAGNPAGRPVQGNGNDQDQYLYLNGQTGQFLPNVGGGVSSNPAYPQQPPSRPPVRPSGPQEYPQGQFVYPYGQTGGPNGWTGEPNGWTGGPIGQTGGPNGQTGGPIGQTVDPNGQTGGPNGQTVDPNGQTGGPIGQTVDPNEQTGGPYGQTGGPNVPIQGGGDPYNPNSPAYPQQPPRNQVTDPRVPPNFQGMGNGQQIPLGQPGTSENTLSPEEIQAIFGQPLTPPGSESQGSNSANPDNGSSLPQEASDPAFPSGPGTVPQGVPSQKIEQAVLSQVNGQSVYTVNGKPLPPEIMDEIRRIQSGVPVDNTGK